MGSDDLDDTTMPGLRNRADDYSSSDDESLLDSSEESSIGDPESLFTPYGLNYSTKDFETRIANLLVNQGGFKATETTHSIHDDDLSRSDISGNTFIIDDDSNDDSIISVTSGNDMARYVFNHCQFDDLHQNSKVYNKSYCNATIGNTLSYISRVGNVRGSKGLHPRNKVVSHETNWEKIRRRFGFVSEKVMKNTWGIATQLANMDVRYPMRRHYKSRFPHANFTRIRETFSTDTMFGSTMALGDTQVLKSSLAILEYLHCSVCD